MSFGRFDDLAVGALCVWRATRLLHAENGPFNSIAALRQRAGDGFWGQAMACFFCLSMWIALPVTLLFTTGLAQFLVLWFALSGAACLLELVTKRESFAPLIYEDPKE
jgi:hypothetical protein